MATQQMRMAANTPASAQRDWRSRLRSFIGNFVWNRCPFTTAGFLLSLFTLVIFIRSLTERNVYEILLSTLALLFLLLLGLAGAWAARRSGPLFLLSSQGPLAKPPDPLSAGRDERWELLSLDSDKNPRFFRAHVFIRGRFFPQGFRKTNGCAVFAESPLAEELTFSLRFPLGGLFEGYSSLRVRDIFGLFSFPCGVPSKMTITIRSAPAAKRPLRVEALSGAEDRRPRQSSDEERYYMREYSPGDRLRDINWKSSARIDTLITRISPDNDEKVTRITVYFRNYRPEGVHTKDVSLDELWLLDRAKARLAWFLRSVREENSSFVFSIHFSGGVRELSGEEEIENFLDELSAIPFAPCPAFLSTEQSGGDGQKYVFSTACDTGLPAFLLSRNLFPHRAPLVFMASGLRPGVQNSERGCSFLHLCDFPVAGILPRPSWLLSLGQRRAFLPATAGIPALNDYATVRALRVP